MRYLMQNTERGHACRQAGFSLIEMVVSVALFSVIMLVAMGALLSLVTANRKARALESVMNNLNISLDGMVRSIRMGNEYACDVESLPVDYETAGADCGGDGGTAFSFRPYGATVPGQRTIYTFHDGGLYRSINGNPEISITAPEVSIEELKFYTVGTMPGNVQQPKVMVVVRGTAGGIDMRIRTTFYIQATAVQRSLDI